jgi:hypothetical protein
MKSNTLEIVAKPESTGFVTLEMGYHSDFSSVYHNLLLDEPEVDQLIAELQQAKKGIGN